MDELNSNLESINNMAEAKDRENVRMRKEVEKLAVEVAEQERELDALRSQVGYVLYWLMIIFLTDVEVNIEYFY